MSGQALYSSSAGRQYLRLQRMQLHAFEHTGKLYNTLKYEWPEVKVDEAVAKEAIKPIQKMLEISAKLGL